VQAPSVLSLFHLKEKVESIKKGSDCGIVLEGFSDFQVGDRIAAIIARKSKPKLEVRYDYTALASTSKAGGSKPPAAKGVAPAPAAKLPPASVSSARSRSGSANTSTREPVRPGSPPSSRRTGSSNSERR
jgi:hypothetical protein